MEQLHAIVSGKVQMVMYRDFTKTEADRLGLVGMVRNLPDGTVEVLAEGKRELLDLFIERLNCGPYHAEVQNVAATFSPATNQYEHFTIEKTPDMLG